MSAVETTLVAVALAMDALAVSIASGITLKFPRIQDAVTIASFFGSFQAFMPLVGWLAGLSLASFTSFIDHWLAFGILSLIGCRMIYGSFAGQSHEREINPLDLGVLLVLSVATSVDALAAGASFAWMGIAIATPIIVIGVLTFALSFLGVMAGSRLGNAFGSRVEALGGVILIGMGIKVLLEHLAQGMAA